MQSTPRIAVLVPCIPTAVLLHVVHFTTIPITRSFVGFTAACFGGPCCEICQPISVQRYAFLHSIQHCKRRHFARSSPSLHMHTCASPRFSCEAPAVQLAFHSLIQHAFWGCSRAVIRWFDGVVSPSWQPSSRAKFFMPVVRLPCANGKPRCLQDARYDGAIGNKRVGS